MNKRSVTVCFTFLLSSVLCNAQQSFPFYEQNDDGEYYLLRDDSIHNYKQFNSVNIITKKGIEGAGKFINLHSEQQKECCTHPDPVFLLGELQLNFKTDSIYYVIGGKVDDGKLFNTQLDTVTDVKRFITGDFQQSVLGVTEKTGQSFGWANEFNGKNYLNVKQDLTNEAQQSVIKTYPVDLKNCIYSVYDSIEILYCVPDSVNELYQYEPTWLFTYFNGKLLDARADYFFTSTDGYGPFFYQMKVPAGWYKADGDFFILYRPGYVLKNHNGTWSEEWREPCLYYGECDCGE